MDEMIRKIEIVMSGHPVMVGSAFVIYFAGLVLLGLLLERENSFNNRETMLALVGIAEFKRTLRINIVHALTIILPVIILTYAFLTADQAG